MFTRQKYKWNIFCTFMLPLDTCVKLNEKIMVICDSTKPQNEIFFLKQKERYKNFISIHTSASHV